MPTLRVVSECVSRVSGLPVGTSSALTLARVDSRCASGCARVCPCLRPLGSLQLNVHLRKLQTVTAPLKTPRPPSWPMSSRVVATQVRKRAI